MSKFEHKPEIGANLEGSNETFEPVDESFADLPSLMRDLQTLISLIDRLQLDIEKKMNAFAIDIDSNDSRLVEAHQSEWPNSLGNPSSQVSFRYYKALRFRDTTAAAYIRERFEEAARDVSGTSDLDILTIADITRSEALLIQDFLSRYIGNVYDSSEQRLLETFQSWVQPALLYSEQLRVQFESGQSRAKSLTQADIESITPEEAVKGQAVFKVKLNTFNDKIGKNIDYLRRNFSEFAPVFYKRFLGPALDFRLNVDLESKPSRSKINKEILDSSAVMQQDLRVALADQSRRKTLYNNKMYQLQSDMRARDKYREMIKDLSAKGKELPTTGPRVMVPAVLSPEEVDYWHRFEDENPSTFVEAPAATGRVISSHGALSGLDLNDHPQYLLRSGGRLTGSVSLDAGVAIDGVIPSQHRHTGEDGSAQIDGRDIIGGSLGDDVVDTTRKPDRPENLSVESFKQNVIPPGVTTIDATISWSAGVEETHEVQITRVS